MVGPSKIAIRVKKITPHGPAKFYHPRTSVGICEVGKKAGMYSNQVVHAAEDSREILSQNKVAGEGWHSRLSPDLHGNCGLRRCLTRQER